MNKIKSSNRFTIIVIAILFAAPVLLTILMHSQWWPYRPNTTRNHGELLQPPIAVDGWPDTSSTLSIEDKPPIWTLLLASNSDCAEACQQQLGWLRQVRIAQGRHSQQVEIQLATGVSLSSPQQTAVKTIFDELRLPDARQQANLQHAITQLTPVEAQTGLTTYLIDPAGFIILRYSEDTDVTGVRKDLRRLLTWSNKARGSQ